MTSNQRVKNNFRQLKEVFVSLLPKNKKEIILLLLFIVFYQSYSVFLALYTSVIDNQDWIYDIYFSFDNPIILKQGYVYLEGHPLMMYFTLPFIYLGDLLASIGGDYKLKTIFLAFICTTLISMSVVYVYRYLVEIIKVKGYALYLFVVFYGLTATNLTLAFTPESFTITAFFLPFTIYYYSKCIQQKQDVFLASNTLFAMTLGGITITNFAKGIIPILFLRNSWKVIIRKIVIISLLFLGVMIFLQLKYDFIGMIKMRLSGNISLPSTGLYYEKVIDLLLTAPIFFSEIIMMKINVDGAWMDAISLDFFRYWWQYAFTIIIFGVLAYATFKNYKNRLVQILLLLLLEDVVIHVLIRYGLRDGFIYGAHWMFVVPFLLGWLYTSLSRDRDKKILLFTTTCLFIFMMINNFVQLSNFINLAVEHFPPHA